MTLDELLNYPGHILSVIECRYGKGFVAQVDMIEHPVIGSVNDFNGDRDWAVYGQRRNDGWWPSAPGETVLEAMENLALKVKGYSEEDGKAVYTAIGIIAGIGLHPAYSRTLSPKTLPELHEWLDRWNKGEVDSDGIFKYVAIDIAISAN